VTLPPEVRLTVLLPPKMVPVVTAPPASMVKFRVPSTRLKPVPVYAPAFLNAIS
jgi:hypothetical protein